MALQSRPIIVNKQFIGTAYDLEFAGDELPEHTHIEQYNHITIFTLGEAMLLGHHRFHGKIIQPQFGSVIIAWIAGEPHGIRALSDKVSFVNIRNPQ